MKVLYVSPNAHMGGAERIVDVLLRGHRRDRYSPAVFVFNDGPLLKTWSQLDVPTKLSPRFKLKNTFQLIKAQMALSDFINEFKPDLIHSTMSYGHIVAGPVSSIRRVREVWFQHGPVGGTIDWLSSKIPTRLILCNSEHTAKEQRQLGKYRTRVVYGPASTAITKENHSSYRSSARARLGILEEEIVISHIGRLDPWKGQMNFLRALKQIDFRDHKIRGLIVGGSEIGSKSYEEELKSYCAQENLNSWVQFLGHQSDVDSILAATDIFVHCSVIPEPLGLTVLEAMAAGCVVIAANEGGPKEIITEGLDGYLVAPRNSENLAKRLSLILRNQDKMLSLKEAARARATTFLAPNWVRQIEELYEQLPNI